MPFTPTDIANLVQWLRADTGLWQDAAKTSACTDGSSVYTWANQGSGAYDFIQATAGNRPTLDTTTYAQPQVKFASGQKLAATHASIAQPFTIFFVGHRAYSGNYEVFISDPTVSVIQATFAPGTDYVYLYAGGSNIYSSATNVFPRSPTAFCMAMRYQGATSMVRKNGTDVLGTGNIGTNGLANSNLMCDAGGSYPTTGGMFEYMLYSRALSNAEILQVEDYVFDRYMLAPSSSTTFPKTKGTAQYCYLQKAVVSGVDMRLWTRKESTEGNPNPPSLAVTQKCFHRFRWAVTSGTHTISVDAKQVSNVAGKRPRIVIKADTELGVNADVTADAGAGAGWVTIGPATVTPSSTGVLWVELWNMDDEAASSIAYFDHIVTT